MRRNLWASLALVALVVGQPAAAKDRKPELSGLELQQIQSRDIDGTKDTVFGAVMSILQDAGYRIQSADKDTGLITGVGSTSGKMTYNLFWGFGRSKKTPIVSAFIESLNPTSTRVRLNFVMAKVKSTVYGSQPQDEEPITDAAVYTEAFEKINQSVFLRQAMITAPAPITTPASSPPAAPAGPPAAAVQVEKTAAH